jgi:hypothetical protein
MNESSKCMSESCAYLANYGLFAEVHFPREDMYIKIRGTDHVVNSHEKTPSRGRETIDFALVDAAPGQILQMDGCTVTRLDPPHAAKLKAYADAIVGKQILEMLVRKTPNVL